MNACICMVGWYFNQHLLETVDNIPGIQLFILSHKSPQDVPRWVINDFDENHLLFEENIGYDWGGYQQFLTRDLWKEFNTIFFLHDDITITDPMVFQHCNDILQSSTKYCLIGNGRVTTKRDWPRTHIQCYAHSSWKPPSWDFQHDTVRGSFIAISRSALLQIGGFEILWDRRKLFGVGVGNYSLRASCGRIQHILGDDAFYFLSESYRHSPYIIELERGDINAGLPTPHIVPRIANQFLYHFSKTIMTSYMNTTPRQKQILARWMKIIFQHL